ncbi:hypothetical protein PTE30175_04983 [Pandoraea terrae]|uniref:Uncharacterized protein n=1 Tax=Pandoraea terrae TaxID=1537710 RepID=A0A5E4Z7U7_9BURK|nr:hypothetical protein PTE30175_04983 [Pandoraea terrae]
MAAKEKVLGTATAMMTPACYEQRASAEIGACECTVPPAAALIVGTCPYYYRPVCGEPWASVTKVSLASTWEAVKAWARVWKPYEDGESFSTLLRRREKLIEAECTDSDWSRHGNFMMRHIGCGHKPPSYYVSYGYYYCSTYGAELYPRLTSAGQAWLVLARQKLQEYLESGLSQNMRGNEIALASKRGNGSFRMTVAQFELELEDETFTEFAFKTHPMAYLDAGLGDLSVSDLKKIGQQPNVQEWADGRTWEQAVESGAWVAKKKASNAMAALGEAWDATKSEVGDPIGHALGRLLAK